MAQRITESLVRALPGPTTGNTITYDTDVKGFGIRVTAAGAKAFVLNYRVGGRERRLTIGSYPDWSAAAARDEAKKLKREIDRGEDPMAQRQEDRAALTVAELCHLYIDKRVSKKRPKTQRDDLAIIKTIILPRWGKQKAASIRYQDTEALHSEISARAPYRANRVLALLSNMYAFAIMLGVTSENPTKHIERNPENPRHRYLNGEELGRLVQVLIEHPNQQVCNAIRLLLLTGARKGEVLSATWDQFDLEIGYWVKPAASVKQARLHRVPLSEPALELLREMRAANPESKFLFPGNDPEKPIADIKKSWAAIRAKAQLDDVRLHDLRHTYASHLASAGNSLPVIGALLGHTQAQTTQRYAHLLDDPLKKATEAIGSLIDNFKN
ncbi:tyrosine-type recombinase/integrase [Microbaculum sp. FT89]|uniref:tyrosine-type recombinase/integrase n=1 Tax=Microbaculum sp. FT89 TaxID=3447298 RepID=UPI003F52ED6B